MSTPETRTRRAPAPPHADVHPAGRAVTLARVGGIDVRAHASWLVAVALVTWSFWDRFDRDPRFSAAAAFVMALAAAVLFFLSVLAHELGHAFEARFRGIPVGGITLHVFGGATEMREEARRPLDEFAAVAVGPFISLTVGCAFGLAAYFTGRAGLPEVAEVCGLLGWLNVGLAVFNLLPGAPLDGGRILRAVAWKVTGDRQKATRIAARAGQVLGGLLVILGGFEAFFVPNGFTGGLWLAFIGWFLIGAATSELKAAALREKLASRPLRCFTAGAADPIPFDATVDDAVERWFGPSGRNAFFVARPSGPVVGVLTLDDVRRVPPPERDRVTVAEVMRPTDQVPWLDGATPASAVLDRLEGQGVAVVFDDDEPIGLVTQRDVLSRLRRDEELGRVPAGAGR